MSSCLQLTATKAHWELRLELQAPVKRNTEIHWSNLNLTELCQFPPEETWVWEHWWATVEFPQSGNGLNSEIEFVASCFQVTASNNLVLCKTNWEVLVQCQGEWAHFSPMHRFRTQQMHQVRRQGTYLALTLIFQSFCGHRKTNSNKKSPLVAPR